MGPRLRSSPPAVADLSVPGLWRTHSTTTTLTLVAAQGRYMNRYDAGRSLERVDGVRLKVSM